MVALKRQIFTALYTLTVTVKKHVDVNLVLEYTELKKQPVNLVKCSNTFFLLLFLLTMPMRNNELGTTAFSCNKKKILFSWVTFLQNLWERCARAAAEISPALPNVNLCIKSSEREKCADRKHLAGLCEQDRRVNNSFDGGKFTPLI